MEIVLLATGPVYVAERSTGLRARWLSLESDAPEASYRRVRKYVASLLTARRHGMIRTVDMHTKQVFIDKGGS